ncbi:uncharacterized protein [Epargyreus clarus]|uniref:uncharacterized protein n=1 Tax=Epargyreus clarus TaxID=520877 RepID=UPI003C303AC0
MSSDSGSDTARSQVNTRPRRPIKMAERVKTTETNAIHVKIPPFWPEKPTIWFAQVEGQFKIANIVDDETKFHHVFGNLDRQYAGEIEDVLTGPPSYERLKSELIKRLSVSRENKVMQLLMHEQLGSRKPSQFLRHLQHLAGPGMPHDVLRTIWTSRLPSAMQPIVASQATLCLDGLADLADRIYDLGTPACQVAATSSITTAPIDFLMREIADLKKQVSELTIQVNRSRPRHREMGQQHRSRSRSQRSLSSYRRYPICWYHQKHGAHAKKCIKPCDFMAGNSQGNQ